ncbi:hypothetical protein Pelo_10909 [Pelomyxa schiedti]|nr:hypothetical protein Pelo_10909 [Pelomyxa schiedti]
MLLWQVWKVADSGKKQVLPTSSSSTAEIQLSWLAGSKFIVCYSGADEGEPDYEVWDCKEDSTGPSKALKAVRFPEPDNRVTVAESFRVITKFSQWFSPNGVISSLTPSYPNWRFGLGRFHGVATTQTRRVGTGM